MSRKIIAGLSLIIVFVSSLILMRLSHLSGGMDMDDINGIVFVSGMALLGSLILVRQPDNRLGWLFSLIGSLWTISNSMGSYASYMLSKVSLPGTHVPWIALLGSWFSDLAWITSVTFLFLLFPDGRLPSSRWRAFAWFIVLVIASGMTINLITPGPLSQTLAIDNPLGVVGAKAIVDAFNQTEWLFIVAVVVCLASIFMRYRGASAQVKQQIKWIAYYGLTLAILFVTQSIVEALWSGTLFEIVINAMGGLFFAAFPIIIGIAILRYRLFDIDVIIRRTLQYGLLTALLAVFYFGSVTVLQGIFTALGGSRSPVITVISTLAIAALFNPLRRRIQELIDRRFYRQKFDAEQELLAFAAVARSETEPERLTKSMLEIVQTAIQPERAFIWLKSQAVQQPHKWVK